MANPLAFLPYALAAYGGYKGYKASKDAGGSGLQRLLAGATGAYLGYQGGQMFPGVQQAGFKPVLQTAPFQNFAQRSIGQSLGLPFTGDGFGMGDEFARQTYSQQLSGIQAAQKAAAAAAGTGGPGGQKAPMNALQRLLFRQRLTKAGDFTGELEFSPGKVAAAIAAGTYLGGAFEPKPIDVYTPTYNLGVAELQRQRGGLKYIDPVTGEEKTFEQPYIPEAGRDPEFTVGNIELSKNTFNTGGLATIKKFNQGGVNFLPSKVTHDENDSNNYVRAQGYVEDGSGTGNKDEDTMLAQLADGEFVTRADGVLGAGILAGGNPNSMKDMREKGAQYFYEQQRRFKRIFDIIEGQNGKNSTNN